MFKMLHLSKERYNVKTFITVKEALDIIDRVYPVGILLNIVKDGSVSASRKI